MVQKSGWIFTTNQQTQNDMSHLRQTTHRIPNVFPIIKQTFDHFQYSKRMSNIKLVKSMRQAPNLGGLLCRSKFESQHKNHEVKNCGNNCVSCPYLLKASFYQFKRVMFSFKRKNVVICQGYKEEYIVETGCLGKEQINIYRKHIRQPQYQQLAVEKHLRTRRDGKFHMFPFFKILQENKSLRKS